MNHTIVNKDIYLPPITFNQPISSLLGYNLPNTRLKHFSDQIIPPLFLENSLDFQNILLHENYVKIPSFPHYGREDAQSATSSTEWIDTEEKQSTNMSQVNQIIEKSAGKKVFSPREPEEYITQEPINFEYPKHLSQIHRDGATRTLGISKASKKITKHTQPTEPDRLTHKEKATVLKKDKPSLEAVRKLRYAKLRTKRNPWRPSEDAKLLDLVQVYGESWAMISSKLSNRTGKQIRDRYLNILRPNLKKGEWTIQEDNLLVRLCHEIGHKWSSIAKHMPGRSEAQVKNRFYSNIKKKIEGGKGEDMHIPKLNLSCSASFAAESVEMEREESRRLFEEENQQAEMSVKIEETEKKKVKLENDCELKIETENVRMETEPSLQARQSPKLKELRENCRLERRPSKWIGTELNKDFGIYRQREVNERVSPVSTNVSLRFAQSGSGNALNNMRVSHIEEKINKRVGNNNFESKQTDKNQARSRGPINEKEVNLVIEILARYYQGNGKIESSCEDDGDFTMDAETRAIKKVKRLQQLDSRKNNLELLLIKTMEEMDKIQNK